MSLRDEIHRIIEDAIADTGEQVPDIGNAPERVIAAVREALLTDEDEEQDYDVTGSIILEDWIVTDRTIPMGWALFKSPDGDRPFRILSEDRVIAHIKRRFTERNRPPRNRTK